MKKASAGCGIREFFIEILATLFYATRVHYKLWRARRSVNFDSVDTIPLCSEKDNRSIGVLNLIRLHLSDVFSILIKAQCTFEKLEKYAETGHYEINERDFRLSLKMGYTDFRDRVSYKLNTFLLIDQNDVSFLKNDIYLGNGSFSAITFSSGVIVPVGFHCDEAIIEKFCAGKSVEFKGIFSCDSMLHRSITCKDDVAFTCTSFAEEMYDEDYEDEQRQLATV